MPPKPHANHSRKPTRLGKFYPPEIKASVKTAYLAGMGSLLEVAEAHGVHPATAKWWKFIEKWPDGPAHDHRSRVVKRSLTYAKRKQGVKLLDVPLQELREKKKHEFLSLAAHGLVREQALLELVPGEDLDTIAARTKVREGLAKAAGIVLGIDGENQGGGSQVVNIAILKSVPPAPRQ